MDDPDRSQGREPAGATTQPVSPGAGQRRSILTAAAIVAALLIGIARPWDLVIPSSASQTAAPAGSLAAIGQSATPAAATTPSPGLPGQGNDEAALWTTCGSPSGWRAATIQQWAGRATPIRSWIAIQPSEATGPLDPRIPFAPVATDRVTAIGYCSPLDGRLRPPVSARAELWAIVDERAVPLTPMLLEPSEPDALGGLWRPAGEVAARVDGADVWPAGRYVLEIRSPSRAFDLWLGIQVEDLLARRTPRPTPGATPTTPPGASPATPGAGTVP